MRKSIIFILVVFAFGFMNNADAQEKATRFYFAGYKAVFIPSDEFRIEIGNPELGTQETEGDFFKLEVKDPNGSMPKDTVWIYTDSIQSIHALYAEVIMEKPFVVDSLKISLAAASRADIQVEANYIEVSAKAFSRATVKGKARSWQCNSVGNSIINASQLCGDSK